MDKKNLVQRKSENILYRNFEEILKMGISPDASLELEYDSYSDWRSVDAAYFSWYETESDEEYEARMEKNAKAAAVRRQQYAKTEKDKEEKEREDLRRLMKKFGIASPQMEQK